VPQELIEKRQFRAIKGTRDVLPPDSSLWNWFEGTAREVFESYNFREIRPPIFEETELFARSIGADTDVVGKEMYTFLVLEQRVEELAHLRSIITRWSGPWITERHFNSFKNIVERFVEKYQQARSQGAVVADEFNKLVFERLEAAANDLQHGALAKAEQFVKPVQAHAEAIELGLSVTLRPEATASVVRAYVEHGMHTLPGDVKLYYVGPMFRRERPQKGRYRQFYQIGAEVLGQSDAPAIDAEVLEMLVVLFRRAGLALITLYINSIGCRECRPIYVELLRQALLKAKDKLGPDSQRRIETNPLRVLDSKLPEEQAIIETLPRISDHLCSACRQHFSELKDELNLRGIAYEENWRLVRGLDYYTRTTFEVTAEGLGSQNAVCGGGRYDGLAELLGGHPTKGIGFAIGSDRAILSIQAGGKAPPMPGLAVFIAWMSVTTYPAAVRIARKLRECGVAVELPPDAMKFKKSLGLADKLGARYALIIGEDEVASGNYTLKRLADGEQKKLNENELLEYLESERRGSGA
jgi:histidyl-tRNA synthetase